MSGTREEISRQLRRYAMQIDAGTSAEHAKRVVEALEYIEGGKIPDLFASRGRLEEHGRAWAHANGYAGHDSGAIVVHKDTGAVLTLDAAIALSLGIKLPSSVLAPRKWESVGKVPAGLLAKIASEVFEGYGEPVRACPNGHGEFDLTVEDGGQAAEIRGFVLGLLFGWGETQ